MDSFLQFRRIVKLGKSDRFDIKIIGDVLDLRLEWKSPLASKTGPMINTTNIRTDWVAGIL